MTRSTEIGPVLDAFLAEGVHELADRVLGAALDDIEHTKQRRAVRVPWRYSDMPSAMRLLLVGAALAGAAGGGFLVAGALSDRPSPSPHQASPGPASPLGVEPAGTYTADRGATFGLDAGTYELVIQEPPGMQVLLARGPDGREVLLGTIDNAGNRATFSATDRCSSAGTYDWALGDGNLSLDLALVTDACEDRASLLAGTWTRVSMTYPLVPGQRYEITSDGTTYAFTVPLGFTDPARGGPGLHVQLDVAGPGQHAIFLENPHLGLFFVPVSVPEVYVDRCDAAKGRGDGPRTLEEFVAWNARTSGSTVSEPVALTIDGRPAVYVDIASGPGCSNGDDAQAIYDGLGPGMTSRTWGIDLGDRVVMVGVHRPGLPWAAIPEDQLSVASELVQSLAFE